jgi:hypothetical protein
MTLKCVPWPVLDYSKQSVAVPGTKRPGQTGLSLRFLTSRVLNVLTPQYNPSTLSQWYGSISLLTHKYYH